MRRELMGPPVEGLLGPHDDELRAVLADNAELMLNDGGGGTFDSKKEGGFNSEDDEDVANFELEAITDDDDGRTTCANRQPAGKAGEGGADDKGWVALSPNIPTPPELEEESWLVNLEAHARAASGPHLTILLQAADCDPASCLETCGTKAVVVGSVAEAVG